MNSDRRRGLVLVGFGAAAVGWMLAARALWKTSVPDNLRMSSVDVKSLVSAQALRDAEDFSSVERLLMLASIVLLLIVLGVYARIGPRFTKESAAGPIGTGIMLAILGVGLVYVVQIPVGLASVWWERRHDIITTGYGEWLAAYFDQVYGEVIFVSLTMVVIVGFARLFWNWWWLAGAPAFVGILLLYSFVSPWMLSPAFESLKDPKLQQAAHRLAAKEGVAGVPVKVLPVSASTSAPNAVAMGLGPSRRVVLFDTLLDNRFSNAEIEVVMAHEFGHHAHNHLWKQIGWAILLLLPALGLVALFTRSRGGMREPVAVPFGLFVLFLVMQAAVPLENVVTRRYEAEADWAALQATRDPKAAEALFRKFTDTALSDPSPPGWAYVLFQTHPTDEQRIAMVRAWRGYATSAQSP